MPEALQPLKTYLNSATTVLNTARHGTHKVYMRKHPIITKNGAGILLYTGETCFGFSKSKTKTIAIADRKAEVRFEPHLDDAAVGEDARLRISNARIMHQQTACFRH